MNALGPHEIPFNQHFLINQNNMMKYKCCDIVCQVFFNFVLNRLATELSLGGDSVIPALLPVGRRESKNDARISPLEKAWGLKPCVNRSAYLIGEFF